MRIFGEKTPPSKRVFLHNVMNTEFQGYSHIFNAVRIQMIIEFKQSALYMWIGLHIFFYHKTGSIHM